MRRLYCIIILLLFCGRVLSQESEGITHVDTISVKEMIEHFKKGQPPVHPLEYYDFIEGVSEANNGRLITSPFRIEQLDIPITNCHAVWKNDNSKLILKKILPIGMSKERAEEIFSMLLKKYGGSRNKGIFASWFTGTLNVLNCPYNLFSEWVSKNKSVLKVSKGVITSTNPLGIPSGSLKYCGNAICINDGCWYEYMPEIECLEKFVRDNYEPISTSSQKNYSLLLFTDLAAKSYVYVLTPEKLEEIDEKVIAELRKTINKLSVGSFRYMETLDGRIFQGRYLKTTYSYSDGWSIKDYIH